MAKQCGPVFITGTVDDITYYKLGDQYLARMKSSLDAKRVKNDPAFKRTMEYAQLLGQASTLAAGVYYTISKEKRNLKLYRKLVGQAMYLLKAAPELDRNKVQYKRGVIGVVKEKPECLKSDVGMPDFLRWWFPDNYSDSTQWMSFANRRGIEYRTRNKEQTNDERRHHVPEEHLADS